jgi:hypothetical protein
VGDPDLLIRTGGEMRISNFLLWQCAYTELYFTPCLWPDFDAPNSIVRLPITPVGSAALGRLPNRWCRKSPPAITKKCMLKQRIITALLLLAVLLPAMFHPAVAPFALLSLLLVAAAGWELGAPECLWPGSGALGRCGTGSGDAGCLVGRWPGAGGLAVLAGRRPGVAGGR